MRLLEFLAELNKLDDLSDRKVLFDEYEAFYGHKLKTLNEFYKIIGDELTNEEIDIETFKKLLEVINSVFHKRFQNHRTLDIYFSQLIRSPIRIKFGFDSERYLLSKEITKLSYKDKGVLIKKDTIRTYEKNKNTIVFKKSDMLNWIEHYTSSDNLFEIVFGLLLCSGSRPIELLKLSEYSVSDEEIGWLKQTGLAKKKTGNGDKYFVHKPVLGISPKRFIELHEYIKEKLVMYNKYVSKRINEIAKVCFKDIESYNDEMTAYDTRGMYANLSFELYGKGFNTLIGKSPTISIWTSSVLGHAPGKTDISKHYNRFTVIMDDFKADEEIIELTYNRLKDVLKKVTQNALEKRLNGIVRRAIVREWYKDRVKSMP